MFSEHGFFNVYRDGSIIIFAAAGAWNLEASKTAISVISENVDKMAASEFAIIADTSEVEGLTPDSANAWFEAVKEWHQKGHSTLARVDQPDSVYYKVYLSKFDDFALANQKARIFDSVHEALGWLHQEGFTGFKHGVPTESPNQGVRGRNK